MTTFICIHLEYAHPPRALGRRTLCNALITQPAGTCPLESALAEGIHGPPSNTRFLGLT